MGFTEKQLQALRRSLNSRHIRSRTAHGRELSYIEGWYVISEANRIFGFDALVPRDRGDALRPGSGKPRDHFSPSISPKCALLCTPMERLSFAKATGRVKGAVLLLARSMIPP